MKVLTVELEAKVDRCIGCRYRTPKRLGGYGFLCQHFNTEKAQAGCPEWILWGIRRKLGKRVLSDEEVLEEVRI